MNILHRVKKFPGGLLLIPMLVSSIFYTFYPIALSFSDPITPFFSSNGTMVLITMILFISGTQVRLSNIPTTLKRSGVLIGFRIIFSILFGYLFIFFFDLDGIWGISAVAFVTCISSSNPGLYLALTHAYGNEVDRAGFGLLNILAVPIVPVMILNAASGSDLDWLSIIATLLPFIFGIIFGNVDEHIRELFSNGTEILLPFLGLAFGSLIDLKLAFQSGLSGIVLTLLFLLFTLIPIVVVDKAVLKQKGYAGASTATIAAIALVVPSLLAKSNPLFEPFVDSAIAQIALGVLLTSVAVPFIVKKFAK